MSYIYVPKREYKKNIKEITDNLNKVRKIFKRKITFENDLIGSGKTRLVTKLEKDEFGYDYDYNLYIQKQPKDINLLRVDFLDAFKQVFVDTKKYKITEKKRVIVVDVKDRDTGKKIYSCDFAIAIKDNNGFVKVLVKNGNEYVWNQVQLSKEMNNKVKSIRKTNGWKSVRDEYLKLKNNQIDKKTSFDLYVEAVNNVYNQIN